MIKNFVLIFTLLLQSVVFGQEFSKTQQPYLPVNYIKNAGGESGVTGYNLYADAAGTTPEDGTGGYPTITISSSTTTPLEGGRSIVIYKPSGSSHKGQGFSTDFTISNLDKGKVLQASLSYQVTAGTYADDDISWFIYDVTNARVIAPAPSKQKNSGIIEKFNFEFQSSIDSTSYRLIGHISSTSTATYTVKYDSFVVGSQPKVYGSAITDWVAYTPTVTGLGTGTCTAVGSYRFVGGSMEISVELAFGGTGSGSSQVQFSIPVGYTINGSTDKAGILAVGTSFGLTGSNQYNPITAEQFGTNTFAFEKSGTNLFWLGSEIGAGRSIHVKGMFPVNGKSASQVLSQDADTRVVNFVGYPSTNQALTASVTDLPLTSQKDSVGAWGGSSYTVKVPGDYQLSTVLFSASGTANVIVYVSGNSKGIIQQISPSVWTSGAKTLFGLVAGDTITLRVDSGVTVLGNTNSSVSISRISGPSQIAASESVICNYVTTAGQSIPSTTSTPVLYGTKIMDSHGAYNTATGIFTAPVSGVYLVNASIDYTPTNTTGYRAVHAVGNSVDRTLSQINALSIYQQVAGVTTFRLLAGQTIHIYALHSKGSAETLTTSDAANYLSIYKIGNY